MPVVWEVHPVTSLGRAMTPKRRRKAAGKKKIPSPQNRAGSMTLVATTVYVRPDGPYIVTGDFALPPGKIVVKPPLPRPLVQVEVNGSMIETFDAQSASCAECPAEMIMKY